MGRQLSVEAQMEAILEEASSDVKEAVQESAEEAAKVTKAELRKTGPKQSGDYNKGWAVKKDRKAKSAIIYNAKKPSLTHLLEKGHVVVNAKGKVGRAPAHPHMKAAEEKGIEVFEHGIESALNK